MFKGMLIGTDEITDYIIEFSTGFIDVELVRDYFYDCKAVLKKVDIDALISENENNHIRDEKKKNYIKNYRWKLCLQL